MAAINIALHRGTVPRVSARLIGDNFAQVAQNCDITAGKLEPMRASQAIQAAGQGDIQTLYQYRYKGVSAFMTWQSAVDVARSPTVDDSRGRIFFTGDGEPRMTTLADAVTGFSGRLPHAWFVLGVVGAGSAPTVVVTGGSSPVESRAYRWTWYTQYAEEGEGSAPVVVSGTGDGVWTVAGFDPPPTNSGTVSAVVSASGVATLTVDTSLGIMPGEYVTVAGTTGLAGLNGSHKVLSIADGTHLAVALAASGTGTAGTWSRNAPHNLAGLKRRIYRTTGTDTTYRLVATINPGDTSYADSISSSALVIALSTLAAEPPPKDLHSLVNLPNGCLVGLSGNKLCFSEPYKPHSWPSDYQYNFAAVGVALVAVGSSVIVLTDSFPYLATTTVPSVVSLKAMPTLAPCVSKRGVVDGGGFALYPSHDGLYMAQVSGVQNATEKLFRQQEWGKLNPETFVAAFHSHRYFARHQNIVLDDSTLVLDVAEPDSVIDVLARPDAFFSSPVSGELYTVEGSNIMQWGGSASRLLSMLWCSKIFTYPSGPVNFACAQVRADYQTIPPVDNQTGNANLMALGAEFVRGGINDDEINGVDVNGSGLMASAPRGNDAVTFSLLDAKGEIMFTRPIRNERPFRLPSGFLMEAVAVQVSASFAIDAVVIAESMDELARVVV